MSFSIVEPDGTERELSKEQTDAFFAMVQSVSDALDERGDDWKGAVRELNQAVPGLNLSHMGGYVPIQGYGTYQGEQCYFRARHQHASFSVGTYDKDPADWLKRFALKTPGCRKFSYLGSMASKDIAPWLEIIAVHVPGLRKEAHVSSWMPKRRAQAQVTDDSDPHGAGYLTPAQCVVIIRDLLIPNLQSFSRKDGKTDVRAMHDLISRMAQVMRKNNGARN